MSAKTRLIELLGEEKVVCNVSMKDFTSFKAGGAAALFAIVDNEQLLMKTLEILAKEGMPNIILGNGTNILVKDTGYSGAFIKLGSGFNDVSVCEDEIVAGASVLLSILSKVAAENNLEGLEFAAGIPGSVGGGVFMNAGAYNEELKNVIKCVYAVSKDGSGKRLLNVEELELGYRKSLFQKTGDIVTRVTIKLKQGDAEKISAKMKDLSARRCEKQPLWMPSAGSFFKRPEGDFAGRLIEQAGLKGLTVGGAMVSPLHGGFIVNKGGATATDIIDLMTLIQNIVYDKSGVKLEPEVRIVGD